MAAFGVSAYCLQPYSNVCMFSWQVEHNRKYRIHRPQQEIDVTQFRTKRSVFYKRKLEPGRYALVLCTEIAQTVASFITRIYTDNSSNGQ